MAAPRTRPSGRTSLRALAELPVAFLSYGFRPFFLLAGLFAALAVPLWLAVYTGDLALPSPLPASLWHGHEMLFGYGAAVLAGFLLTATPSWSGGPPVKRHRARGARTDLARGTPGESAGGGVPALAAAVDLAFLPALAIAHRAGPASGAPRAIWCSCRSSACCWSPTSASIWTPSRCCRASGSIALRGALDLFVLLIGLIGGRVVPAFTRNALAARGDADRVRAFSLRDRLAIGIPRAAADRRSCGAHPGRRRGRAGSGPPQRLAP